MKKYLVVSKLDGEVFTRFYDDEEKAVGDADILMVSLGGYAEVYERQTPTEENDYAEGYTLIYNG